MREERFNEIKKELVFKASRSQGPGGQHVNKVSSRIEIRFNIRESLVLNTTEKACLEAILGSRITQEGELLVVSQISRSQLYNKEDALMRLHQLLTKALSPRKKRIATKPSRGSVQRRLDSKKRHSQKKEMRNRLKW